MQWPEGVGNRYGVDRERAGGMTFGPPLASLYLALHVHSALVALGFSEAGNLRLLGSPS